MANDAAIDAGGRVVKFQTYRMEAFMSPREEAYSEFGPEALSYDQFRELAAYCARHGATFLSTPFDLESADFLEELDVPAFKIASGDLTFLPLLRHVARKGRPIILSTTSLAQTTPTRGRCWSICALWEARPRIEQQASRAVRNILKSLVSAQSRPALFPPGCDRRAWSCGWTRARRFPASSRGSHRCAGIR